jgi:cyclopropane fatty-acyl-phospholipid synthase-like methyltransferase
MENQYNWYTTFFEGLALEMWDNAVPAEYTRSELNFIKEYLPPGSHQAILDIPCGSGRHAILLAESGFDVTGIDISAGNIMKLNEQKNQKGLSMKIIHGNILEYDIPGRFDMAICMGNSFGYFAHDQNIRFLKKVSFLLKDNGLFLINTGILAESILMNYQVKRWYQVGNIFFLIENFYEADESRLRTEMVFLTGEGRSERKTTYQYIYTLAGLKNILTAEGFNKIDVFSDLKKTRYKAGDQQAYVVAGK